MKPLTGAADFSGLKIRVMESPIYIGMIESMGGAAVPMAFSELYTGLQQGTVEASEGPWDQMKANNLEEVQDYIIETAHISESVGKFTLTCMSMIIGFFAAVLLAVLTPWAWWAVMLASSGVVLVGALITAPIGIKS